MDNKFKGLTVNERLYESGLIEAFDKAVEENDVQKVTTILKKVEITEESEIKSILKAVGLITSN
jgi:hypothetical protein